MNDFHEWARWSPYERLDPAKTKTCGAGEATNVTWAMEGRHNFMGKLMCLFISMDKMIGKDFEAGLASLKEFADR